jgi:CheY-like chemotaxis protein
VITCFVPGQDQFARELGAQKYLVKPVSSGNLLAAVQELGTEVQTVLVADDDPEILQLFGRILTSTGHYQVLRASNGEQALDMLRTRKPHALILDLSMPLLDGFQVLREKARDAALRAIPAVIVSSQDPSGSPLVSETLQITRPGGLSASDLVAGIEALTQALLPNGSALR